MITTRNSFLALALATTIFLGFSSLAMARQGNSGGWHNGGSGYAATMTPEQVTQAQQLHDEFYASTVPLRQQMIVKRAELDAERLADKPDPKKIEQLCTELGSLRGKMLNQRDAFEAKFSAAGFPAHGRGPCGFDGDGDCGFGPGRGWHGGSGEGWHGGSGKHGGGRHGGGHRGGW